MKVCIELLEIYVNQRRQYVKTFEEYQKLFGNFYNAVKIFHKKSEGPHRGHGLDHDVTVAQIASYIAPDSWTAKKSWCSGMLHSIDHMVERGNTALVEQRTRDLLRYLPDDVFKTGDLEEICQAAVRHSELNRDDQSVVQQVLMDADRLANLMPAVVIRAGQFLSGIPAFEFEYLEGIRNPVSNYRHPQSVLDNLRTLAIEYVPQFRIPKAKDLADIYATELEEFILSVETSYKKLGLVGISL